MMLERPREPTPSYRGTGQSRGGKLDHSTPTDVDIKALPPLVGPICGERGSMHHAVFLRKVHPGGAAGQVKKAIDCKQTHK